MAQLLSARWLFLAIAVFIVALETGCGDGQSPVVETDGGSDLDSDTDSDVDTDSDSDSDGDTDTGEPPYDVDIQVVGPFTPGVHGMVFSPAGTLFFSDSYEHQGSPEQVYSLEYPYTGTPEQTGIEGSIVSGLLWLVDSLYVCATGEDQVRRYDDFLVLQETWTVPNPWNVELVGPGILAVTYDGRVFGLGQEGAADELVEGLEYPFDIADNGDDTFWISEQVGASDGGRLRRWGLCGEEFEVIEYGFDNPEGLAVDDRGYLYVADTVAGEILRVDPLGEVEVLTDEYEIPIVVVSAPDGDMYFNTGGALSRLVRIGLE